jgi:hypothetical protein
MMIECKLWKKQMEITLTQRLKHVYLEIKMKQKDLVSKKLFNWMLMSTNVSLKLCKKLKCIHLGFVMSKLLISFLFFAATLNVDKC